MKKNVFHKIIWYVVIFSLIGLFIEIMMGFLATDNRRGCILGPLCVIYGICATVLIFSLQNFKNNIVKIFIWGAAEGTLMQFLISFAFEAAFGIRFWNYTNMGNVNGRICIAYAVLWGVISIVLVEIASKILDKAIDKIQGRKKVIIDTILTILIVAETLFTVWGVYVYKARAKMIYNDVVIFEEKNAIGKLGDKIFTNEIMEKVFPNIRFLDDEKKEVWIKELMK